MFHQPSASIRSRFRHRRFESLEQRRVLDAIPVISEFMAINQDGLRDVNGDTSDWIELFNAGDESVNLDGFFLTDDAADLNRWRIPDLELRPGEYETIFASGKDRTTPGEQLHTDFSLRGGGEYLALVAPDGVTVVHDYGTEYPPQVADVAFGLSATVAPVFLVPDDASARYQVPIADGDLADWTAAGFDDLSWQETSLPVGYETGAVELPEYVQATLAADPLAYWRFNELEGTAAISLGRLDVNASYENDIELGAEGPDPTTGWVDVGADNTAARFDGSNDFVVADRPLLNDRSEFTITALVNRRSASGNNRTLIGQNGVVEARFPDPESFEVSTAGGGRVQIDNPFVVDQWHHVAIVGRGFRIEIYVDGQLVGAGGEPTGNYGASDAPLNIGGEDILSSGGREFRGRLDEVAIFDVALTSAQIQRFLLPTADPDQPASLADAIQGDIEAQMHTVGSSLLVRVPLEVDNPQRLNRLRLDINYDDAFVAYLNGSEIARRAVDGEAGEPVAYDATASGTRGDSHVLQPSIIDVRDGLSQLRSGTNVLAVHLLNASASDPDALLDVQLEGADVTVDLASPGYLTTSTPGQANAIASDGLGPVITAVSHAPDQPRVDESITVTAQVDRTLESVADVQLVYRVMYGVEQSVSMVDDGSGADGVAGDGIYTGTIPAGAARPGEMIRWKIVATDASDEATQLPRFEVDLEDNNQPPEYLGTVVFDPEVHSGIQIMEWFVEQPALAQTPAGTRATLFYNGDFYDNVFVRARAGDTTGKGSYKFDFQGAQFHFDPAYAPVEEFNLKTTFLDKAYVRQPLAYEAYSLVGLETSISFPVHLRQNGEFFAIHIFIEEPSAPMLERAGLDGDGALYKMRDEFQSAGTANKKTRTDEDDSDLADFIANVASREGDDLKNYLFDNVNLPAVMNYLVGTVLVHQNDSPHKNYYLFRDSEGSGEWQYLAWDHDLTWGRNYVGTSASDVIYADQDVVTKPPLPSADPAIIHPSHPLVHTQDFREFAAHWNRLTDAILRQPEFREMYLRRLRSAMDEFLGEPGTTDGYFDQRFDHFADLLREEAAVDKARWASPWSWPATDPVETRDQTMQEAIDILKTEYLEVRRQHLYVTHSIDNVPPEDMPILLPELATARYFVPTDNSLGADWIDPAFDDSLWDAGQTGIGFERTPRDYTELIKTRVQPSETTDDGTSIFVRAQFDVEDPDAVEQLTLRMRYDDAFIAYLNGTEVARSGIADDADTSYNSADGKNRTNGLSKRYESFPLSEYQGLLRAGNNVLAIHGLNGNARGNDMLILPQIVDGYVPTVPAAGIPHAQVGNPTIHFDPNAIEISPASGNQDEEYIKLDNPHDQAVDVSGWRIEGGVQHRLRPGTVIPAGGSLYLSPDVTTFRARATGPGGGQGLFVQGDYVGHLSNRGESLRLVATDGQLIDTLVTTPNTSDTQDWLRISEVNYNPTSLDDADEYIELINTSDSLTLDLTGVTLSEGPSQPYRIPAGTSLAPGQYLLVAADTAALQLRYPQLDPASIVGQYEGRLNNDGERIKLDDGLGNTVVDVQYNDDPLWPARADGVGGTLVLDQLDTPAELLGKAYVWRGSREFGGSPAAAAETPVGVVVNELVSSPSRFEPIQRDAIELFNRSDQTIDLSGWAVSDSPDDLLKYRIPAGTQLAAGEYLVIEETEFNPDPENQRPQDFGLSRLGDDVWVVVPDASGTGVASFVDEVRFSGSQPGESLARQPNGTGWLTPATELTLGAANQAPRIGPLFISEIQYNPSAPSSAALRIDPDIDRDDLEYLEIHNPTTDVVFDLGQWQLRGGVSFDFEPGTVLAPGQSILVLPFNPESDARARRHAAFVAHYEIDANVPRVGGYQGQLSNSYDRIHLRNVTFGPPGMGEATVDDVIYDDVAPWPTMADGLGSTLHRVDSQRAGHEARAWTAGPSTPGVVFDSAIRGDFDGSGFVDDDDIELLCRALRSGDDPAFDLTGDGMLDDADRDELVFNVLGSTYGDANLDRVFNSDDLTAVIQAGKYDDDVAGNSTWRDGDWDCDGDFTSDDLLLALAAGGYRA